MKSTRTAHLAIFLGCLMVIVALCVSNVTIAGYAIAGLAFLSMPVAMKHAVGDLAMGGGLKGAWKALTTDAKPAPPAGETP